MNKKIDLNQLNETLREKIREILDALELSYEDNHQRLTLSCPVHGGDNENACSLFIGNKYAVPTWKCFTHQCESEYGKSLLGFIKGVLSEQQDKEVTFVSVLKWISDVLSLKLVHNNVKDKSVDEFLKHISTFCLDNYETEHTIKREQILPKLAIPAKYYIDKHYSSNILLKYDVGLCKEKKKPMTNRIVVPVYDENYEFMVGCTGRSIFPECKLCFMHHADYYPCPTNKIMKSYAQKWKHSPGFSSGNYLYNYWFAKKYITQTEVVILVEGPADVWRLEEAGIHNSVAIFGVNLTDQQKVILERSGATTIVCFFDPDKAGENAKKVVAESVGHMYNIEWVESDKEPGDLTTNEIKERLAKYL